MTERFQGGKGLKERAVDKGAVATSIAVGLYVGGSELVASHLGLIGELKIIDGAVCTLSGALTYYLGTVLVIPEAPEVCRKLLRKVHRGERI